MPNSPANTIHVVQGQFEVSDRNGVELTTLLGSCVAACFHDPVRKIGGMNHFLLPGSDPRSGQNAKYGAHSMEELINALLRAGALRQRLQVQLFGGANVVEGLGTIGAQNAQFAQHFVRTEGFRLVASQLGGKNGRRVRFSPTTGTATASAFATDQPEARAPAPPVPARPRHTGQVELF